MKKSKTEFINEHKESTNVDWNAVAKEYGIKPRDVFYTNTKYTTKDENNKDQCSVYCVSNGNAFDCPSLKRGACNVPCYGLNGCYVMYDDVKINKEFQRIVLKIAPIEWLFDAIKYLATSKRMKKGNLLRFFRLNEVSDLTQELLDKICDLCDLLYEDVETRHIVVFTYTKMGILDFSRVAKMQNFVINTSQTVNPVYKGGNVYIAVTQEYFDKIVETDIVKKCNCDIACTECGYCYEDGGYIIFCLIH